MKFKKNMGDKDNEKLHPGHAGMGHAASIAHAILSSAKGYACGGEIPGFADGGMLEAQSGQGEEMEALSESGDEFLSYEPEEELDGVTNTNKRLSSIFNGIRLGRLKSK